ncbi:MAG: hypothetical protein IJ358_00750 [Clostridia bacterium]|nr:hypothetical protein [Clostridia bacterium]
MEDNKETVVSKEKELEIENMQEFLLENQDIKLENLPRYEDIIAPKTETKLEGMQEVNQLPFFETKVKPKEEIPTKTVHQKRFTIAVSCFAIIGVLLLSLVAINGVALAMLNKDVKDNQKDIDALTEEVAQLQNQGFDVDSSLTGDAENVSYKLALPRNYPDNTADLTWFDKLSIFLMKLFG